MMWQVAWISGGVSGFSGSSIEDRFSLRRPPPGAAGVRVTDRERLASRLCSRSWSAGAAIGVGRASLRILRP